MLFVQPLKAVEGGEELVVAAPLVVRDEGAHGEGVNQLVVEVLIGAVFGMVNNVGRGDEIFGAGFSCGFHEFQQLGIHAQPIFRPGPQEALRIDCAAEVHVQIGALGHGEEEGSECEGAL